MACWERIDKRPFPSQTKRAASISQGRSFAYPPKRPFKCLPPYRRRCCRWSVVSTFGIAAPSTIVGLITSCLKNGRWVNGWKLNRITGRLWVHLLHHVRPAAPTCAAPPPLSIQAPPLGWDNGRARLLLHRFKNGRFLGNKKANPGLASL